MDRMLGVFSFVFSVERTDSETLSLPEWQYSSCTMMISASPIEVHAVRVSELSLVPSLVMGSCDEGRTSRIGARPLPMTRASDYWCR